MRTNFKQVLAVIAAIWLVVLTVFAGANYTDVVDLKSTVEGISVPDVGTRISGVRSYIDDKIATLRTEFSSSISNLQERIDGLKDRVTALESQEDEKGFTEEEFREFVCYRAKEEGTFYNHTWKVADVNITTDGIYSTEEYSRSKDITLTADNTNAEPSTITVDLTNTEDFLYIGSETEDITINTIYFETATHTSPTKEENTWDTEIKEDIPSNTEFIKGIKLNLDGVTYTYPDGFEVGNSTTWVNETLYQPECVSTE